MAKKKKKAAAAKTPDESFEESISELSQIVRDLEGGDLSLDESLASYESGIRYLKHCQKILATAERKIELLSGFDADGNPVTQRFDDEEMSLEEKADKRSRRRSARPTAKKTANSKSSADTKSTRAKPVSPAPAVDEAQDDVDETGTLF